MHQETLNTNDVYDLEVEDVNSEMIPEYNLNFSPLVKWTKYYPKSQVISETSTGVLTRAQQKKKKVILNKHQEFYMFNSFM